MRRLKSFHLIPLLILCLTVVSCDDGGDTPQPQNNVKDSTDIVIKDSSTVATKDSVVVDPNVTPATVSESKTRLQGDGIALAGSLENMRKTEGIGALTKLVGLTNTSILGEDDENEVQPFGAIAKNIISISNGQFSRSSITSVIDDQDEEDESVSFEKIWTENKGSYVYNASTDEFDFTEGGDVVSVSFPSTDVLTTNDAQITISDFASKAISAETQEDLDIEGGLPTKLRMSMSIDGVEAIKMSFDASYDSDDSPTSVVTALEISPFSLELGYELEDGDLLYGFSIDEGSNTILAMGSELIGEVNVEKLQKFDEDGDVDILSLESAEYFAIALNTGISVTINQPSDLVTDIDNLDDTDANSLSNDEYYDSLEIILNNYIDVVAAFTDTNQKIADASIEVFEELEEDCFCDDAYEVQVSIILTYDDGTKVDLSSFIEDGFEELEEDLNELIDALEEDTDQELD